MISQQDRSRSAIWEGVGGLAPNNNGEKFMQNKTHSCGFFCPPHTFSDRLYRLLLLLLKLYYKIYVIGKDPD